MVRVYPIQKKQWPHISLQNLIGTGLGLPIVNKIINDHSGWFFN